MDLIKRAVMAVMQDFIKPLNIYTTATQVHDSAYHSYLTTGIYLHAYLPLAFSHKPMHVNSPPINGTWLTLTLLDVAIYIHYKELR